MARRFADAATVDAMIVNGDLAINGSDDDAEIAFATTALENLLTRVTALPASYFRNYTRIGSETDIPTHQIVQ